MQNYKKYLIKQSKEPLKWLSGSLDVVYYQEFAIGLIPIADAKAYMVNVVQTILHLYLESFEGTFAILCEDVVVKHLETVSKPYKGIEFLCAFALFGVVVKMNTAFFFDFFVCKYHNKLILCAEARNDLSMQKIGKARKRNCKRNFKPVALNILPVGVDIYKISIVNPGGSRYQELYAFAPTFALVNPCHVY